MLIPLNPILLDGNNFRRIRRILQVNHQSVVTWVNLHHAQLQQQGAGLTIPQTNDTLEVDGLFTFVCIKKQAYIVTIGERVTRCIVSYAVCRQRTPKLLQSVIDAALPANSY